MELIVRFGAHAFIWAADWSPEGAEKVIRGAAEAGLDFVEIPLLHPESFDAQGTRALLDEHGIGCTAGLGLPAAAHLPFAPDAAEAFLRTAVDSAVEVGSPVLTGATYTHLGTLTRKPPTDDELAAVREVLGRVAAYAAERGIALGIEACNRYETYLINLASDASRMARALGEPSAFVHLDTYHMNIEEKGFAGPIRETGDLLGYVHLSESDRGVPGTGNVDWDDVFRGLADVDYDGFLAMESFAAVNEDIIGATAMWRDVVGDPQALVTDGLAFLRGKAEEHGLGRL